MKSTCHIDEGLGHACNDHIQSNFLINRPVRPHWKSKRLHLFTNSFEILLSRLNRTVFIDQRPLPNNLEPMDETFQESDKQDYLKNILYIRYKRLADVFESSGLTLSQNHHWNTFWIRYLKEIQVSYDLLNHLQGHSNIMPCEISSKRESRY